MSKEDGIDGNILLDENTIPYLFSNKGPNGEEDYTSQTGTDLSMVFDKAMIHRARRCFKINLYFNVAMLIFYVCVILFVPWFSVEGTNIDSETETIQIQGRFSLLLV